MCDVRVTRQAELPVVPTEFAGLLVYQKTMSQLVLKETLAGLQQELDGSKARGRFLSVKGEVR